ncbi:SH3 domain-containing protein [Paracoccus tegillarcae]|nr:SH3 domain-containing protein [Paracoccus tegillarcae]
MRLSALALTTALLASPALATQEYILPTLFDVTGVADDDVLNIRQQPSPSSQIIGRFAPDQTGIEVVDQRNGWALVNTAEQSGWASMRYLTYRTDVWQAGQLPAFTCAGTEPFWGLRREDGDLVLDGVDLPETSYPLQSVLGGDVFRDPSRALLAEGLTVSIMPQQCSDGMSDRRYGLRGHIIRHGAEPRLFQGCCTIQP